MTEAEAKSFVEKFEAAWKSKNGEKFLALWHPDGVLHSPHYNREIAGRELGALNELLAKRNSDLVWSLKGWTFRGDVVVVEWETANRYGDKTVSVSGVDRFTLRDGKIGEEVVYSDTALFRAAREGRALVPLIVLPASLV